MRKYGRSLLVGGLGLTTALWLWFGDRGLLPWPLLPSLVLFPIGGALVGASAKPRLLLGLAGGAVGLIASLALATLLSHVEDAWAERALTSIMSVAQGGSPSFVAQPGAGCPAPGTIAAGNYEVVHRDNFFGSREFVVQLPTAAESHFSLTRSGLIWQCAVGPTP